MSDNNKTEEFLEKLAPCIERGELEACVEEAARLAGEMGIGAEEILDLSVKIGYNEKYDFEYVLALAAALGLEGKNKSRAYSNAGIAANFIGKLKESEDYYKKAIELDPKNANAHYNYASLIEEQDRKIEAEEQYKIAIKLNPKDADAHNNYALLLVKLGREKEAEEHYKKAIELNPKNALAYHNYARLLVEVGREKEAVECYKKSIELYPKLIEAHTNYAILLQKLGRKKEAEGQFKDAIQINPKIAYVHNNYAVFLIDNAQLFEAEKEVRIALKIEPNNPYAHGNLGEILADEGYFADAEKEYNEALKYSFSMNDSTISEIHNNLGWAYAQLKKYNKAKTEFKKAIALDPMNVTAIRNLRALGKVTSKTEISKIQMCLAGVLLLSLLVSFYLFWINRFSETMFATQSSFLIALIVFIFLYHQLIRFKAGPFEFEKSIEHRLMEAKSQPSELERC